MAKPSCFWHADKKTCLDLIWNDYEDNGRYAQMLRHFYYVLLSREALRVPPKTGKADPADQAYKWVSNLLVEAREQGTFPWTGIIDSGRRSFPRWRGTSLKLFAEGCQHALYTLDSWLLQPYRLEVWVEKDDMADALDRMITDLRIPIFVAKGYASATIKNDARKRYGDGSRHVLLYCGDFDPSGLDIERELKDTLAAHGVHPTIERVTLTYEQTLELPPSTAVDLKESDTRTKRFKERYPGSKGYEMNILGARQLETYLLAAISKYMDRPAFDEALRLERLVEQEAEKRLHNVMNGFVEAMITHGVSGCSLPLELQQRYFAGSTDDLWG
jgi:hypothetical protein